MSGIHVILPRRSYVDERLANLKECKVENSQERSCTGTDCGAVDVSGENLKVNRSTDAFSFIGSRVMISNYYIRKVSPPKR